MNINNNNITSSIDQLKTLGLFPTLDQFKSLAKKLQKLEPQKYKTYNNALDGLSQEFGKRKFQAIRGHLKDVCRWTERLNDEKDKYHTTCNHTFNNKNQIEVLKYCPYCAKKIEVVFLPELNEITIYKQNIDRLISQKEISKENIIGRAGIGKTLLLQEYMSIFDKESVRYLHYDFKEYLHKNNFHIEDFFKQALNDIKTINPFWMFIDEAQLLAKYEKEALEFIKYLEQNKINLTLVSINKIFENDDFTIYNLNDY